MSSRQQQTADDRNGPGTADQWTRAEIERLTDVGSFTRGWSYQRDGRVEIRHADATVVRAVVRGSIPYDVELRRDHDPTWSCTCPVGDDGAFCKHCVAVALALGEPQPLLPPPPAPDVTTAQLREYVTGLDHDELIELVLQQADADWRLRELLNARALAVIGQPVDVPAWTRRIDAAFGDERDFIPYAEAEGWASEIFDVITALGDLADAGHATTVVGLAEYAHRRADAAVQYIDDSDGWLTDIGSRLGELHLSACEQARPDPVELAQHLAELELTSELGTFHRAAVTYADVLGTDGLAAYRQAVEPDWRATRKAADPYGARAFSAREAMGRALGDLERFLHETELHRDGEELFSTPSSSAATFRRPPAARADASIGRRRSSRRCTAEVPRAVRSIDSGQAANHSPRAHARALSSQPSGSSRKRRAAATCVAPAARSRFVRPT